jgi:hypothetical protein
VIVRTRKYVAMPIVVLLAIGLTQVAHALGWSKAEMYAVGAGLLVVVCLVALPWIEMAPDGAWGRPENGSRG